METMSPYWRWNDVCVSSTIVYYDTLALLNIVEYISANVSRFYKILVKYKYVLNFAFYELFFLLFISIVVI